MAENYSSSIFLTEDIVTSILLRLPTASCIARFRCVCRSWRILLSDPQFIRRILSFTDDNLNNSSLQILITGEADSGTRHLYSLLSYDTLHPISATAAAGDLPSIFSSSIIVAGSCDGIFCIVDMNPMGGAPDVILWNPATSETKFLPVSTGPRPRRSLNEYHQATGFGFDPRTNDYKVARIMCFDDEWDDHGPVWEQRFAAVTYAEVYSLRNNSWKRLTVSDDLIPPLCNDINYVHPGINSGTQRHNCYWFYAWNEVCFTLSFDMIDEVFESTSLSPPPVANVNVYASIGCSMLKDSLVAAFQCNKDTPSEIWGLLKLGLADSWTKLYSFTKPVWFMEFLQVWKDGAYICYLQSSRDEQREGNKTIAGVYLFSPAMGEYDPRRRIEIEGATEPYQAHTFTPTQISLSHWE